MRGILEGRLVVLPWIKRMVLYSCVSTNQKRGNEFKNSPNGTDIDGYYYPHFSGIVGLNTHPG
jgi:hypothetical protein